MIDNPAISLTVNWFFKRFKWYKYLSSFEYVVVIESCMWHNSNKYFPSLYYISRGSGESLY